MIPTYNPAISVMLIKSVSRTDGVSARYTAANRMIDLTPYLGNTGTIRTRKSLHEPDGRFSLTFADKMEPTTQDTLYALIEPMDVIEIRATRRPDVFQGDNLPLIMRGYVSSVGRPESMSSDGTPQRQVVVHGQDAGKFWLIHNLWFEIGIAQERPMMTKFALSANVGINPLPQSLADFVTTIVNDVMNPKVAAFAQQTGHSESPFTPVVSVKTGQVIAEMYMNYEGPMWQLIDQFADRPWNELFIVDTEAGPQVVFRECPFKDIHGKFIMANAVDPGTLTMPMTQALSVNPTRSDAGVANFFYVPPGASLLFSQQAVAMSSLINGNVLDFNYGNNAPDIYGDRKMVVPTAVLATDLANIPTKLPLNQRSAEHQKLVLWNIQRQQDLKALNRDNIVWEQGFIAMRGREDLQIGMFLQVDRGDLAWECYMSSVEHTIVPLQSWTSTVGFERGSGTLARNAYGGSPYLAEGRPGPYMVASSARS